MYAWQTLAMARVDFRSRDLAYVSQEIKEQARDLLYTIGLPHFPAPEVFYSGVDKSGVDLRWDVDNRTLVCTFPHDGSAIFGRFTTGNGSFDPLGHGPLHPRDFEEVQELVGWLLFGTWPPK